LWRKKVAIHAMTYTNVDSCFIYIRPKFKTTQMFLKKLMDKTYFVDTKTLLSNKKKENFTHAIKEINQNLVVLFLSCHI
jgi:hypothetical protein